MIEKQFKLGTVIAERELFFQSKNKKQKIIVKIGKPKYLQNQTIVGIVRYRLQELDPKKYVQSME